MNSVCHITWAEHQKKSFQNKNNEPKHCRHDLYDLAKRALWVMTFQSLSTLGSQTVKYERSISCNVSYLGHCINQRHITVRNNSPQQTQNEWNCCCTVSACIKNDKIYYSSKASKNHSYSSFYSVKGILHFKNLFKFPSSIKIWI